MNIVSAGSLAADRGTWGETTTPRARDYTNRLSVRAGGVDLSGTTVGTTSRPRLVEAFDQQIEIELAPHVGLFRYLDIPARSAASGRSSAWRTSTSRRWRSRARAPRAAP